MPVMVWQLHHVTRRYYCCFAVILLVIVCYTRHFVSVTPFGVKNGGENVGDTALLLRVTLLPAV